MLLRMVAIAALWGAPSAAQTAAPPAPPRSAAAPSASAVASVKNLGYPPLRSIEVPHVDSVTLPNGMKLYLLEDHELPLVSGTALVRTGNLFDPRDKIGLPALTGTST